MNRVSLLLALEAELASAGFVADRKPTPEQDRISLAGVKRIKHYSAENRARAADYHKRKRERWLRMGIVKPRNEEEQRIAEGR
jgi:hypothetical protein